MPILQHGSCLEVLRNIVSDSFDSLITDPPAGINFMGKDWDHHHQFIERMTAIYVECLRVLKPGAHGLVWAIPRTSHWTATALEDAGFEIRDVVTHLFGSGFPKSMDISKAIDKAAGAERDILGTKDVGPDIRGGNFENGQGRMVANITTPSTDAAKQWQGWGTALKPASEHWILVRKPTSEKTVAANVLKHCVGGINIDVSRVGNGDDRSPGGLAKTPTYKQSGGNQTERPTGGRFPANLVLSHNPDCVEVGTKEVKSVGAWPAKSSGMGFHGGHGTQRESRIDFKNGETVAAFECTPGCAVAALDEQSGVLKSGAFKQKGLSANSEQPGGWKTGNRIEKDFGPANSGGASRFFYCSKASKKDKGEGNSHPTPKNTTLMSYLIKLITPPGGVVLDPFMGSGSTGVAAIQHEFEFVGIEKELEYFQIARQRMGKKN